MAIQRPLSRRCAYGSTCLMMSITLSQTNRKIRISMVCSGPKNEADRREEKREYGAHSDAAHHIQLDEIVSPTDGGSLLYVSSIEKYGSKTHLCTLLLRCGQRLIISGANETPRRLEVTVDCSTVGHMRYSFKKCCAG